MRLSTLLAKASGGGTSADPVIKGVTADSRDVQPGFLFAALSGTKADGAAYIPDALKRGAAAVLVAKGGSVAPDLDVPVIETANPRAELAQIAARFYPGQPACMVAVTGTNGKTSVASFLQQLWQQAGHKAASIGTLGVVVTGEHHAGGLTTPDPVTLHRLLAQLADRGVAHAVLEASSHGLKQHRVDGVRLSAAGFTNISRDHLDYHEDFADYLAQKTRLFSALLPADGTAVINVATAEGRALSELVAKRGIGTITVAGVDAEIEADLKLIAVRRSGHEQEMTLRYQGREIKTGLPLAGMFQAENALLAAGLAIACGGDPAVTLAGLADLEGPRGRLELAGQTSLGAAIYIDYAHTPDALETALRALKPYAERDLVVVFGCGGDRDRGKRPQMGAAACAAADKVFVTDDNPRSEDPGEIRAEILAACPGAKEVAGRAEAIAAAVGGLDAGDVLLIAGKGHETGQIIAGETVPFSDHDVVAGILGARS
jgi:UDP-N-acetylmuramoyl-L-alanyl-D-glutamate--2,6-diaminopimelate ligase